MDPLSGRNVPVPTPETQAFWDACKREELLIQRCKDCGHHQFYPRIVCTACSSRNVDWVSACGKARITSFTIVRRAITEAYKAEVPYVVALVKLEEGPDMMTNIVDCDIDAIAVGDQVQVCFHAWSDKVVIPKFKPAG